MTENQRVIARLTIGGEQQSWDLTEEDISHIGIIRSFVEEQEESDEAFQFPLNGLHNITPQAVQMALEVLRSPDMEQRLKESTILEVLECMKIADFLEMNGDGKTETKSVLHACAKYIANQIRGKTEEEIKILFKNH